jgi:hypothetical protein
VLAVALCLGAVLRCLLALTDDGIYWPDEIYQSLEPAHRLVFGQGLVAWEFVHGARNWTFPGLVAGLLKLSAVVGLDEPRQYLDLVKLTFSLAGIATAYGSYLLARAYRASALAAACGAALFALAVPAIYFAPRALSETASTLPIVLGYALVLDEHSGSKKRIAGTSLLGLSVLIRLQNGIFCVGLIAILAGRRQWRLAAEALAVLAGWALLFGLIDKLTWGGWFHSARVYLDFSLAQQGASRWGEAPFEYYLTALWTSLGGLTPLLLAVLAVCGFIRAPGLFLVAVSFLLLHSFTPHKELRFMMPALPLFCALAALGMDALPRIAVLLNRRIDGDMVRRLTAVAVLTAAFISVANIRNLTFGDIGQYDQNPPGMKGYYKPDASAYDHGGAMNRLLLAAHEVADLCGLKLESVAPVWTGGYTYLDRDVPLYAPWGPPRESGYFNYAITGSEPASATDILAEESGLKLVRLGQETCVPDPGYEARV